MFQSIMKLLTPTSAWHKKKISSTLVNTTEKVGASNHTQVEENKTREIPLSRLPDDVFVEDRVCDSVLKELKVQSNGSLDDVAPIIDNYQKLSSCHVAIYHRDRDCFRLFANVWIM